MSWYVMVCLSSLLLLKWPVCDILHPWTSPSGHKTTEDVSIGQRSVSRWDLECTVRGWLIQFNEGCPFQKYDANIIYIYLSTYIYLHIYIYLSTYIYVCVYIIIYCIYSGNKSIAFVFNFCMGLSNNKRSMTCFSFKTGGMFEVIFIPKWDGGMGIEWLSWMVHGTLRGHQTW